MKFLAPALIAFFVAAFLWSRSTDWGWNVFLRIVGPIVAFCVTDVIAAALLANVDWRQIRDTIMFMF